jgi:hemerythrin
VDYMETLMNTKDHQKRLVQFEVLEKLIKTFFTFEQRLHDELGYFDANAHRISHESYIRRLKHTKRNFLKTGATPENEELFITRVVDFFEIHILRHDVLFAIFYIDTQKNQTLSVPKIPNHKVPVDIVG